MEVKSLSISDYASLIIACCAVAITGLVIHRVLTAPPTTTSSVDVRSVDEWEHLANAGHRTGPAEAPVTIVEFADLQCPYCARAEAELASVLKSYPDRVAVVFRHFPLESIHPNATRAAIAAECAGDQGRFSEFKRVAFQHQDSIAVAAWEWLASRAGVIDEETFADCVSQGKFADVVGRDIAAGDSIGVRGTPTFVVNGNMFSGTPPTGSWTSYLRDLE